MPEGILEVSLVSAKGLENTDIICKGSNPVWNETFLFDISSKDSTDLKIKIMDSDSGSADDLVGHARQVIFLRANTHTS
ncbi:putative C2 domain-containing protein [Helianthus annuus]|nr:putative C2 domain-containing protein [Helianthus annuus]